MTDSNLSPPTGDLTGADDPFFRLPEESHWNACIGSQGDEENYIDGYLEAASELASAVIDKKMHGKRDTLVLPILYNARHAIELTLKFVIDRLFEAGVLPRRLRRDHDILAHWQLISDANLGDQELRRCVTTLEPFVKSLSRIDDDGQELRYHLNRDEEPSLATYSLANLEIIRDSLAKLSEVAPAVRDRTIDYIRERGTGAYTDRLSRSDLISVAQSLPPRCRWTDEIFDERKRAIKDCFGLGSKQFAEAVNVITQNREMKALVGQETTLEFLPDALLIWIVQQWRKCHPPRKTEEPAIVQFNKKMIAEMMQESRIQGEVVAAVETYLTSQQIAELQAIYYLGRDRWFPEPYERQIESIIEQHKREGNPQRAIDHLITKTNFLQALIRALPRLGRPSLARKLSRL